MTALDERPGRPSGAVGPDDEVPLHLMDLTVGCPRTAPERDVVDLDDSRSGQAVAQVGAVARPRAVQVDEHLGLGVEPAGGPDEGLEVDPVADAANRRSMPWCSWPSVRTRSEAPDSTISRTLSRSRIPARWVFSISSTERVSKTTESMPERASRWLSMRPAGTSAHDHDLRAGSACGTPGMGSSIAFARVTGRGRPRADATHPGRR